MAAKKDYPGGFRLTIKKAQGLALQEFGTAKGLKPEGGVVNEYRMEIRNLNIRIHTENRMPGRIILEVRMRAGYGSCFQIHDAETLEEDFEAEERYREEERRELIKELLEETNA